MVRKRRGGDPATLIADVLVQQAHAEGADGRNLYLYALALTEAMGCRHAVIEVGEANRGHHPLVADGVAEAERAVAAWIETNRPAAPGMH